MSDAVAAGLYHPNCKDIHSTYYGEDDNFLPISPEEKREILEKLVNDYNAEQKMSYAKKQEEKYGRLAEYSLDEENKREYEARAQEWENVIENSQKNDIIESDLGVFKEKLRNDDNISEEYYKALKDKFSHGSKDAKHLFAKYASGDTIEDFSFEGIAHFNTETKKITMNYGADLNNSRGTGATWFHEHGHLIDDALGVVSNDKKYLELLKEDSYNYRVAYGKMHNLKTFDKVDRAISNDLSDMRKHSSVSDLLNGLTNGNIQGCAKHDFSYWENEVNITSEAFAHMFEAQFDKIRYEQMKQYFPKSLKYYERVIEEVAK